MYEEIVVIFFLVHLYKNRYPWIRRKKTPPTPLGNGGVEFFLKGFDGCHFVLTISLNHSSSLFIQIYINNVHRMFMNANNINMSKYCAILLKVNVLTNQ